MFTNHSKGWSKNAIPLRNPNLCRNGAHESAMRITCVRRGPCRYFVYRDGHASTLLVFTIVTFFNWKHWWILRYSMYVFFFFLLFSIAEIKSLLIPVTAMPVHYYCLRLLHFLIEKQWWILNTERWTLNADSWKLNADRWPLNAERWPLNADRWTLTADRWTLNAERWPLNADRWLL